MESQRRQATPATPRSPCASLSGSPMSATSDRPFTCPIFGCTSSFKRKYTMKDHVKSHTGEKPFVCPVPACSKSFTTSGNLARHKRLHPWLDAPVKCLVDGCECEFANEIKLERHMMAHFGETKAIRCEVGVCGKVFSTAGNLRRHIKQSHGFSRDTDDDGDEDDWMPGPTTRIASHESSSCCSPSIPSFPQPSTQAPRIFHPITSTPERVPPLDEELLEALSCLFDREP